MRSSLENCEVAENVNKNLRSDVVISIDFQFSFSLISSSLKILRTVERKCMPVCGRASKLASWFVIPGTQYILSRLQLVLLFSTGYFTGNAWLEKISVTCLVLRFSKALLGYLKKRHWKYSTINLRGYWVCSKILQHKILRCYKSRDTCFWFVVLKSSGNSFSRFPKSIGVEDTLPGVVHSGNLQPMYPRYACP